LKREGVKILAVFERSYIVEFISGSAAAIYMSAATQNEISNRTT
jgi:hypothetical protein